MFRTRLHPTPAGFALGIVVVALWALLWLWFLVQLGSEPARRPLNELTQRPRYGTRAPV